MGPLISSSPSGDEREAEELAARFGLAFEPRRGRLVEELFAHSQGAPVLLLGALSADLFTRGPDGAPVSHRASLGMALLRFSRALAGQVDPLVRAAALRKGERVIDATLGLGGDALLAAHATGAPVLALEKSPLLAAFTQAALRRPGGDAKLRKAALEAGARIDIRAAEHLEFLSALPSRSAEVVLFDPMFRSAIDAAPIFEVVRAHAEPSPLAAEALAQARRVATRGVLIKDSPRASELRRLGLPPIHARRFLFGWLEVT